MKTLLLLTSVFTISSCSAEQWYAMGRHGGCYDLAEFSKSDPLITGAKSPSDIESKLKKAGIVYTLSKYPNGILMLDVSTKEWGLILAQKKHCKEFVELP